MIEYDFEKNVSYWVGLTSHLFETTLNNELSGTGITLRQVQVISCLVLYGEMAQNVLATQLRIEPSTLVRILDRMERDKWIERSVSPQDRRKKIVRPTDRVLSKWETIVECGEKMEKRATSGLSKTQLKNLKDILETIRKNLVVET